MKYNSLLWQNLTLNEFRMRRFLLLCLMFVAAGMVVAQEKSDSDKVYYKFGGMIDLHMFYDSYNSVEYRDGALYFFPQAPSINSAGVDESYNNRLRANVLSSRLSFAVGNVSITDKAKLSAYIETDFLGASSSIMQHIRIRHAYAKVDWARSSILMGQSWHLAMAAEMVPNVMSTGAFPFLAINRNPMVQYSYKVRDNIVLDGAAMVYLAMKSVGPGDAQSQAVIPDLQARVKFGDPNKIFGGVMVGGKFMKPRTYTDEGYRVSSLVPSMVVTGFFKAVHKGHTFRINGMYGGNLSAFTMLGGYGKLASDDLSGDYGYSNIRSFSGFADYQCMINKWELAVFGGYQRNFGSAEPLDMTPNSSGDYTYGNYDYGYYQFCDVEYISRIAPRVVYHITPKFFVGIEYGYTTALWGETFDEYYRPTSYYDTSHNHRIETVARFVF